MHLDFFRTLADLAADTIRPYFGTGMRVDWKSDATPVTEADRAAERAMRKAIRERFPTHGLLGEEYGPEREEAEFVWVMDPIDGTKSFVAGVPLFVTLIGLLHHGKPIAGAIAQPVLNELVLGTALGATYNGTPAQIRPCATLEEALLLTTDVSHIDRVHNGVAFTRLRQRTRLFRTWGDGYGYLMLCSGRADVMVDAEMHPWDILPLMPIVEGAGGRITAWDGSPAGVAIGAVASHRALHADVLQALNPA